MMVIVFAVSALILFLLGVPMAVVIGLSSIIYIFLSGIEPMIMIQRLFAGVDVPALMAIPFFVLAGNLMLTGGLADRILNLTNAAVGRRTGSLAIVSILGCMFFAAISGSAIATAAALTSIMVPAMEEKGYDRDFASAVIATASPMGVIIPPSITFIIYGTITGTSISDLYLVGLSSGLLIGIVLMIVAYMISKKKGYKGDRQPFEIRSFFRAFKNAVWALGTPLIMIGGVFNGIFTPTESGVIAVVYSIVVGLFIYKDLKLKDLPRIFLQSAKTSAEIMYIIANASLFAYVLTFERIPQMVVDLFLTISESPIVILLLINLLLLIAGALLDTIAIIVIMVPLFMPIIQQIGMDPVVFGAIVIVNTAIGMSTPPFGVCLFAVSNIAKTAVQKVTSKAWLPISAMIVVLLLITYFPEIISFPLKR
jgi:C4-dicarboxylate transporter, DctM subunit